MIQRVRITTDGLEALKNELDDLVTQKRPAMLTRLAHARAMGDLRENSEYTAAREEQAFIEGRILELKILIEHADVIEADKGSDTVQLGSRVKVKQNGAEKVYAIVGEFEASPLEGKLSSTSPLGKSLIGKKIGQSVQVTIPAGTLEVEVLAIL